MWKTIGRRIESYIRNRINGKKTLKTAVLVAGHSHFDHSGNFYLSDVLEAGSAERDTECFGISHSTSRSCKTRGTVCVSIFRRGKRRTKSGKNSAKEIPSFPNAETQQLSEVCGFFTHNGRSVPQGGGNTGLRLMALTACNTGREENSSPQVIK